MPPKKSKTAPARTSKPPTTGTKKPDPKANSPPPPAREEKNEFVESDPEDGEGASLSSHPSGARASSAKNGNGVVQHSEDFEDEYRTVQEQSANGLALMTDTTLAINEQIVKVEGIPSEELFMDADQLNELQNDVVQTKKLLLASHRYLKADYTTALEELRDAIDRYAKALLAKLKDDRKYVIYKGKLTENELRAMQQRNAGHKRTADIVRQLLELEKLVEDIALTAEGIEAALMDVVDEAEKLKDLLKEGKREGEEMSKKEEEDKQSEDKGKEEEKEEEPPKEEEKRDEDEEAKRAQEERERLEREERERLERLRREEEERRRRELEEEERRLREEAERKRREGPKHFPPLVYNVDDIEESFINGENRDIACVVRSPPELGLQKEQLEATLLNMLANRYPSLEGEELFSNLIRLRPTNGQDLEFSEPVYIALPNNGGVKGGREFCIKIQEVAPPPPPPPEEPEEEEVTQTNEATSAEETGQDKQTDNQEETGQDAEQTENKEGEQEEGQTTGQEGSQEGGQAENQETGQEQDAAVQEEADKAKKEQDKKEEEEKAAKEADKRREAERRESRVVKEQPKPVVEEVKPVEWEEMETQETSIEGLEGRFVETKVTKIPATGLNILVVTRPKHEKEKFNSKGGKFVWAADPRISVLIPKNAFRLETELGMQVVPVDSASLAGLKERYDGCDDLLGTSPLVRLTVPIKPSKAFIVSVTNPTGGSKSRRPEGGAPGGPGGRPSLPNLKPKPATTNGNGGELDVVNLMMKDPKGRWKHADDVQLHPEKDSTTFEFSEIHDRLVLLRTKMRIDSAELIKIVTKLETSLAERAVTVVVRQSNSNPAHFWLDCSRKENTERVLQRMREGQFTEGPDPSAQICLREGDVIKMSFRDNLDFEDRLARQVVFNSNLTSASIHATVNALNTFAQNALDFFRGYIQLSLVERPYQAPPRLAQRPRKDKSQDGGFLCELPLTLPKPTKGIFRKKRIELPIPTEGPLCEEYFNHLANEIKDEWLKMAPKLGHDAASIQRITQYHAYLGTDEALYSCVRQMLVDWFKAAEKSKDKVNELRLALLEGERADLAEELVAKDKELKAELEKQQREALLEQCIKAYSDSQAARKSWRPVAKALGLSHEDMAAIAGDGSGGAVQVITLEQAKEMLTRWQQLRGEQATKESLIVVLKKLKLNEAAANVSLVR